MNPITGIYTTTVGKKILMAVTGIILVLYVLAHMLGNLQIYISAERIDAYARFLHSMPPLLWFARAVLLFCVLVHIVSAVQLWLRNRASRPVKYRVFRPPEVDLAARTMVWSGPILLLFIIYHLLHLTTGDAHPSYEELAPFHNVVTRFAVWWGAGVNIVANPGGAEVLRHPADPVARAREAGGRAGRAPLRAQQERGAGDADGCRDRRAGAARARRGRQDPVAR